MFEGAILNPQTIAAAFHGGSVAAIFYPLSQTASDATPLILTGLSVAIAFRAGLFNIGAAGQWVGGAIVATYLGFAVSLPPVVHVVVCLLGGFAGGAVIGWLVGELKARTGAHEVIVTIMTPRVRLGARSSERAFFFFPTKRMADLAAPDAHASAQPRGGEIRARRDPHPQRGVQPRR